MGKYNLLREFINKHYEQYSGLILEKYFRAKIAEEERITRIGSYWDSKGGNKIDTKANSIKKELAKYEVELRGLTMNDM